MRNAFSRFQKSRIAYFLAIALTLTRFSAVFGSNALPEHQISSGQGFIGDAVTFSGARYDEALGITDPVDYDDDSRGYSGSFSSRGKDSGQAASVPDAGENAGDLQVQGSSPDSGQAASSLNAGENAENLQVQGYSLNSGQYLPSSSMNAPRSVSQDGALIGTVAVKEKVYITPYFAQYTGVRSFVVDKADRRLGTVSKRGLFKGKRAGLVTVRALDSSKREIASRTIQVEKPVLKFTPIGSLSLSLNARDFLTGTTISPNSWESSKEKVAVVNPETGELILKTRGSTTITAVFGEGRYAAKVKAKLKLNVPTLNKKCLSLRMGKTAKLKVKGYKGMDVKWSTDNFEVATVDLDGYVTAIGTSMNGYGKTVITAEAGGEVLKCKVYVMQSENQSFTVDLGDGRTKTVKGYYDFNMSDDLFELVNDYRIMEGRRVLSANASLDNTAMVRARELSYRTTHWRPNGEECFTAFPDVHSGGENIAAGYKNADAFFKAWKESPEHNANMLGSRYRSAGMMVFVSKEKNWEGLSYRYYAVQCFTD
ncbi:MAG: hypothetical protein K5989_06690 [Lachnospiraceae bacterium]|nr:hypothetical protein [Lachnospiraceae bacterium]